MASRTPRNFVVKIFLTPYLLIPLATRPNFRKTGKNRINKILDEILLRWSNYALKQLARQKNPRQIRYYQPLSYTIEGNRTHPSPKSTQNKNRSK